MASSTKPLNPNRLQRNGHSEESPLGELPAVVAVAAGLRIFRLLCQYASSRQYPSRENHLARAGWRLQKPLNPSQHTLTAPFRGHTASALLQRASPLFDFHRKSHCRSNAARDRAYSNVDSSLQIIADVPPRRLMPPSLMWIPSTNNIADVDFANAKPLNPSRFQQQAGPCQAS